MRQELVVIVHGYYKNSQDMSDLCRWLEDWEYTTFAPRLPTTFGTLEDCHRAFAKRYYAFNTSSFAKIHFVGHSFGGLIIRSFLSRDAIPTLGRCVLIGTPNHGAELVNLIAHYGKPALKILKTLASIPTPDMELPPILPENETEIGIIAGNNNHLWTGPLIHQESDGRVEVESTKLESMKDFIILPYVHNRIHHEWETAQRVHQFLQLGHF